MSVVVLYEGRRKVVKLASPNSIIQDVLNEAAAHFSLNPSTCVLKHKKSILSNSQLFRFSNVPNNAIIDLVVESSNVAKSGKPAKIAFSLPSGGSVVKVVDSGLSIRETLEILVRDKDISAEVINGDIEVIFMRNTYSGESLSSTLISSLGLSGESGRFLLKYGSSEVLSEERRGVVLGSSSGGGSGSGQGSNSGKSIVAPSHTAASVASASTPTSPLRKAASSALDTNKVVHIDDTSVEPSSTIQVTPEQALDQILAQNFDRVSAPAVITIFKYLSNIASHPDDGKFRSINLTNKVFLDKVKPAKFALEYLASVGFIANGPGAIMYPQGQDQNLKDQLQLLDGAMNRLQVPVDERPRLVIASPDDPRMSTVALAPFDPFKAFVVRNASQPPREEMSRTERNLQALREKRRQLEGSIDEVQRQTEVLLPRDGTSVPSLQKFAQDEGFLYSDKVGAPPTSSSMTAGTRDNEPVDDDREASALLSQSVLSAMRKAKQLEDAPLTTAAMKELQQLERERIYTRVLVRVRFPDVVSLQGYFHPRHTMLDVHQWVVDALSTEFRDACSLAVSLQKASSQPPARGAKTARTGPETTTPATFFELYTSPPRRVLLIDSITSLYDLNFAPAVVINLAWLVDVDALAPGMMDTSTAGFYLSTPLLSGATERQNDASAAVFPVGQDLTKKSAMSSASSKPPSSTVASASADSSEKSSAAKVPKWFKIGR